MGYGKRPHKPYGLTPRQMHAARSLHARKVDERLKAPIAKTPEQWKAQPNRFDVPDVDTPTQSETKKQDEELKKQLERFEQNLSPTSHSRFRANLSAHKLYGVTH